MAKVDIELTDREAEFLDVLWDHGASTVAEVRERLRDEPAYTTVLTILRNLVAKGHVRAIKEGRAHRFAAVVERAAAQTSALQRLSEKFFNGSAELLVAKLVADERLTDDAIGRIREILDEGTESGEDQR